MQPVALMLFLGLIIMEIAGDTMAKQFSITGDYRYFIFAIFLIICGNICWQFMLRNGVGLAIGGVLFGVSVSVGLTLIGVFYYGERLEFFQWVGIFLGVCAIACLSVE